MEKELIIQLGNFRKLSRGLFEPNGVVMSQRTFDKIREDAKIEFNTDKSPFTLRYEGLKIYKSHQMEYGKFVFTFDYNVK